MTIPVIANMRRRIGCLGQRSPEKILRRMVDVENHLEVESMERVKLLPGLVKRVWVKLQRTVPGVPAVGAIADHGTGRFAVKRGRTF